MKRTTRKKSSHSEEPAAGEEMHPSELNADSGLTEEHPMVESQVPVGQGTSAVIYKRSPVSPFAFTFISENVSRFYRLDLETLLNDAESWKSLLHPEDLDRVLRGLQKADREDYHVDVYRIAGQDSDFRMIKDEFKIVRDDEGHPVELVGYWIDITDRPEEYRIHRSSSEDPFRELADWIRNSAEEKPAEKVLEHVLFELIRLTECDCAFLESSSGQKHRLFFTSTEDRFQITDDPGEFSSRVRFGEQDLADLLQKLRIKVSTEILHEPLSEPQNGNHSEVMILESLLYIPIAAETGVSGFLCLGQKTSEFHNDDIPPLRLIAETLSKLLLSAGNEDDPISDLLTRIDQSIAETESQEENGNSSLEENSPRELLPALFQSLKTPCQVVNRQGEILATNQVSFDKLMTGKTTSEDGKRWLADLFEGEELDLVLQAIDRSIESQAVLSVPGGSIKAFPEQIDRIQIIPRDENAILVFGGIPLSREEQKETGKDEEFLYRELIESSPDSFLLVNLQHFPVLFNGRFLELTGFQDEQTLRDGVNDFREILDPDFRSVYKSFTNECLVDDLSRSVRLKIVSQDGRSILCEFHSIGIRNRQGEPIALLHIIRDLHSSGVDPDEYERKILQLESRIAELEHIQYITTHDLRTPLLNIRGFSDELLEDLSGLSLGIAGDEEKSDDQEGSLSSIPAEILESVGYIQSSALRMDNLLSELARYARLGKTDLNLREIDMNLMLADLSNQFRYRLEEAGISFQVDQLPACQGDSTLLSQVFSNLIDNAIKYLSPSRSGRIHISGEVREGKARYMVQDNGIGIAEDQVEHIFEVFHRASVSGTAGQGLGLSIVRKIIKLHQGEIDVSSKLGEGSVFTVTLNSAGVFTSDADDEPVLFLFDDDPVGAELLKRTLTRSGLLNRVEHFAAEESLLKALQMFPEKSADDTRLIVILPYRPAGPGGIDLLKKVQSLRSLDSIHLIMLSSAEDEKGRHKCQELGCDHFFVRPLQFNDLLQAFYDFGFSFRVLTKRDK